MAAADIGVEVSVGRIHRILRLGEVFAQLPRPESLAAVPAAVEAAQGRRCGICGRAAGHVKYKGVLVIDHDHDTDLIRGVLCHRCNILEGKVEFCDRPEFLIWRTYAPAAAWGVKYAEIMQIREDGGSWDRPSGEIAELTGRPLPAPSGQVVKKLLPPAAVLAKELAEARGAAAAATPPAMPPAAEHRVASKSERSTPATNGREPLPIKLIRVYEAVRGTQGERTGFYASELNVSNKTARLYLEDIAARDWIEERTANRWWLLK